MTNRVSIDFRAALNRSCAFFKPMTVRCKTGFLRLVAYLKSIDSLITAIATFLLFIATTLLAWIAWLQYQALEKTDHTLNKTLIASSRAWVGPRNAKFEADPMAKTPIDATVEYQNVGKEPALNFSNLADFFAATIQEDKDGIVDTKLTAYLNGCLKYAPGSAGSVVYPSTGFSSYFLIAKSQPNLVDDAVIKGEKLIFVQGCFAYKTFDILRHTYFCYFYKQGQTKPQNLNICSTGHYAD